MINDFFNIGHMALWFLVVGLFLPRLTLAVSWFLMGAVLPNTLWDVCSLLLWLFFPRFLIAFYISLDMGTNNFWFWAYVLTGILGVFGESGLFHRRVIRRTTITRDGATTTTVEEEL